jgi:hypothetical protein
MLFHWASRRAGTQAPLLTPPPFYKPLHEK